MHEAEADIDAESSDVGAELPELPKSKLVVLAEE